MCGAEVAEVRDGVCHLSVVGGVDEPLVDEHLAQRPNLLCLAAARAPGHFTRRLGAIAEIRHGRKVDALARSDPLDTAEEELVVELGQREGTSGFYISKGYDGVRARKVPGVLAMSLQETG